MARRAVLHSALFKNGLSEGSESAPGCIMSPRAARSPGSRQLPDTRLHPGCRGSPSSPETPELRTQADALAASGTDRANSTSLRRAG